MTNVYDNGEMVLGNVYNVKNYICKYCDEPAEIKEIINFLEDLDEDTIVVINYDMGIGYSIDYWIKESEVKL